MKNPVAVVALMTALSLCAYANSDEPRVWTTSDGQHSTVAEFVELDGETVVLRKRSGDEIRVPLARLSTDDRNHVRRITVADQLFGASDATEDLRERAAERDLEVGPARTAAAVEAEAQAMTTAKDALLVYEMHLAGDTLPSSERRKVNRRLPHWQKLADDDRVRLGDDWVTREEAEAAAEEIESYIDQAFEMLRLGNGPLAEKALDAASRIDPNAIDAEFLKGLIWGLVANNDREAADCFAECVERMPANAAAQNNLGVSLFLSRRIGQAVDAWLVAAALAPESEEIANNLGCVIAMEARGLRVPGKRMEAVAKVYLSLLRDHDHDRPTRLVLQYVPPHAAGTKYLGVSPDDSGDLITIGSGSGFVVSPGMIVTNHHVIEDGVGVLVLDPEDSDTRYAGKVVASDKKLDIALIDCPDLDAPALPISTKLPRRGADIMVLGYPMGLEFGANVKSTRGAMVAMPDTHDRGMCLYDAVTNPGNSGGPLCDSEGRVVAVVREINRFIGGVYGGAIPMSAVVEFLDGHLPGLDRNENAPAKLDWPEVDARVSPSTVLILNRARTRAYGKTELRRGVR